LLFCNYLFDDIPAVKNKNSRLVHED